MRSKTEVLVYRDASELCERGAHVVANAIGAALARRDRCALALAGGSTPAALYRELARLEVDWARVDVLFGDERAVPPEHQDSNYRMARTTLLDLARVPPANVHRAPADAADLGQAARDYEATVRRVVRSAGGVPRFDVILLGVGAGRPHRVLVPAVARARRAQRSRSRCTPTCCSRGA
ncbi:MAG: 6-phosphogluconolactonase [Planctomycetota bacterium]